jgi:hypothetical protein
MKRILAAAFGAVLLCFVVLSLATRNTRPVLLRLPYRTNSAMGNYNWVVFNPFRDRTVERVASAYLEAMRRGDCVEALKVTRNIVLPNNFDCAQMQAEYRDYRHAFVQRLRDRSQGKNEAILYYSNNGYEGNWVTLRRFGSDWRIVEFNKFW